MCVATMYHLPCAWPHLDVLCYILIPAKTNCPTSWTTEYVRYLMSADQDHTLPTEYVCVDKDPESVTGLDDANWTEGSGIFRHVEAS